MSKSENIPPREEGIQRQETPLPLPHEQCFTELESGGIGRRTHHRVIRARREVWARGEFSAIIENSVQGTDSRLASRSRDTKGPALAKIRLEHLPAWCIP